MKTSSVRIIVMAVFTLTLCAGAVAGYLAARLPAKNAVLPAVNSSLAQELELTADQRKQMQSIWEGVRDLSDKSYKNSQELQSKRDAAIQTLVPPDKIASYNAILHDYAENNAKLDGHRKAAFEEAVKRTKEILSPAQQKKYDEILAKRLGAENPSSHDPIGEAAEHGKSAQPSS